MERVAIDTTVPVYAVGAESPYRGPCRLLIDAAADGAILLEASVEIVQEVAHVRARRTGDRGEAVRQAQRIMAVVTCHSVDPPDVERALVLFAAYDHLDMLDAIHAASALNRGISTIVTADHAFDHVPGLQRIDPVDAHCLIDH